MTVGLILTPMASCIIAKLTVIVSPLFADIIQCMAIQVLEIKKSELSIWRRGTSAHLSKWYIYTSSTMDDLGQRRSRLPFQASYPSVSAGHPLICA